MMHRISSSIGHTQSLGIKIPPSPDRPIVPMSDSELSKKSKCSSHCFVKCGPEKTHKPELTSQTLTVLSTDPDTILVPLELNATELTESEWSLSVHTHSQESTSQILTVLSIFQYHICSLPPSLPPILRSIHRIHQSIQQMNVYMHAYMYCSPSTYLCRSRRRSVNLI